MTWNHELQRFDPPKVPRRDVDDDLTDEGAGRGLALGLILGVSFWTLLILSWRGGVVRDVVFGVVKVLTVVAVLFFVVWASNRVVLRWRAAHPDNPVVDWLRRSGL